MGALRFAKEVVSLIPYLHIELVRRQPKILIRGKITFPQMVILDILHAKKECKMGDIAKTLGVTKSAVTGLTDRLIGAGFIRRVRSSADRRVVRVYLTPKGQKLSQKIDDYKLKTISSIFRNINKKERMQYVNILRKMQKNIKNRMGYRPYE